MRISQPTTQLYTATPAGVAATGSVGASSEASPGDHVHAGYGQLIQDVVLAASQTNVTFTSIPQTFKHLRLAVSARGDGAAAVEYTLFQLNGDTAADYLYEELVVSATAAPSAADNLAGVANGYVGAQPAATETANYFSAAELVIPDYAVATKYHTMLGRSGNVGVQNAAIHLFATTWKSLAAITAIKLFPSVSTNFVAGSRFSLYGEV